MKQLKRWQLLNHESSSTVAFGTTSLLEKQQRRLLPLLLMRTSTRKINKARSGRRREQLHLKQRPSNSQNNPHSLPPPVGGNPGSLRPSLASSLLGAHLQRSLALHQFAALQTHQGCLLKLPLCDLTDNDAFQLSLRVPTRLHHNKTTR